MQRVLVAPARPTEVPPLADVDCLPYERKSLIDWVVGQRLNRSLDEANKRTIFESYVSALFER